MYPITLNHGQISRGRPANTYIDHLSSDTGYEREELANAMQDRAGWRERVMKCRASSTLYGKLLYSKILKYSRLTFTINALFHYNPVIVIVYFIERE